MKLTHFYSAGIVRQIGALLIATLVVSLLVGAASKALTPISQNYATEKQLATGSIVSLKDNAVDEVIASSSTSVDNLIGVVIATGSALIELTDPTASEVQVATNGIAQVLVSDINGEVKQGDHITASPIAGVGMKATNNVRVVGVAQGDLGGAGTRTDVYKNADGTEQRIVLGQIPVLINVAYFFKEAERTIIPTAIQNVANALAGREVSTLPIILAAAVFLIMLIVVVSIIYSMIRSSIISVGRNPLSQSAIYRDLIQLSGLVLGILAVGFTAIYLILTRI